MSYAIIGFGRVGQALAKAFACNGIEISVATTRDPESFASAAAAIGSVIIPKKLAEAVKANCRDRGASMVRQYGIADRLGRSPSSPNTSSDRAFFSRFTRRVVLSIIRLSGAEF